jgi:hypothetical protein
MNFNSTIFVIILIALSFDSISQTEESDSILSVKHNKRIRKPFAQYDSLNAINDFNNNEIKILIFIGFNDLSDHLTQEDIIFQKKYNFRYTAVGCFAFSGDKRREYNNVILKQMDEKYGVSWRIGLSKQIL